MIYNKCYIDIYIGICTVYNVHCTLYNVQCTVYNVQCIMYNVQCTMYSVQCKVYNVQCTMYSVKCTSLDDQSSGISCIEVHRQTRTCCKSQSCFNHHCTSSQMIVFYQQHNVYVGWKRSGRHCLNDNPQNRNRINKGIRLVKPGIRRRGISVLIIKSCNINDRITNLYVCTV